MKLATIRDYCLAKNGVMEDRPFDLVTIVMRVSSKKKIFAFFHDSDPIEFISLKCDPDLALALRAQYPAVTGGYHLSKKHWNTVALNGTVPEDEVFEMIDHSYELIVESLPKKVREELS